MILHILVPALVVAIFFRDNWKLVFLILIATMIVDVDHLLADPIYDPSRCSIGFHPLHQPWLIGVYTGLCFISRYKILQYIGMGLLIHMSLDSIDCQVTNGVWLYLGA